MGEEETLEVICKKLKVTILDKHKLKREQEPKSDLKDGLQILAARMDTIERDRGESRDRFYDRGRSSRRGDGQYDRGRRYDRDKGRERGHSREQSHDRGQERNRNNRGGGRERSRDRNDRYRDDGPQQCYEYKETGKCSYRKRTGYACRFEHEKSKKEENSDSESGGSTDGRALKGKK